MFLVVVDAVFGELGEPAVGVVFAVELDLGGEGCNLEGDDDFCLVSGFFGAVGDDVADVDG